jgi:hypothetical protein
MLMPIPVSKLVRKKLLPFCVFCKENTRIRLERWLRGSEEIAKLRHADAVFVSYGKSGRTWLRVMLSRYYQKKYELPDDAFLNFDNLHRINQDIPRILFTHDNYIKDYTGNRDNKRDFYNKKVVLLVRDPRDVAVSQYFQWKHRMSPGKKIINRYPPDGSGISLYDFVMKPESGMPSIIEFMNLWHREAQKIANIMTVRYEDMRADTRENFRNILVFLGNQPDEAEIEDAVTYAAFENMRQREQSGQHASDRLAPKDAGNPDSYKVRRAKVGGYRDYFEDAELLELDNYLASHLDPSYGYPKADHPD